MRLFVTDTPITDKSFDMVIMSVAEFNNPACHLFIISNDFDEVVVELSDRVKCGMIRPLMERTKAIPKIEGSVSSHMISLLCEMYPEKSAEMRYAYMRNREELIRIIKQMRDEYGWDNFY